jgi:hypothetical protein
MSQPLASQIKYELQCINQSWTGQKARQHIVIKENLRRWVDWVLRLKLERRQ